MKPLDYVNTKEPYAHRTTLGWGVIGSVCQGRNHQQRTLQTSMKCHPHFHAKTQFSHVVYFPNVFVEQRDDELLDFSIEEEQFFQILDEGVKTTEEGVLPMPLPFKSDHPILPNNHCSILSRSLNTLNCVRRNAQKLNEALKFMGNT